MNTKFPYRFFSGQVRQSGPFPFRLLMASLFVATPLLLNGCNPADLQAKENTLPPPPAVDVMEVNQEDVTLWDSFTGRVAARESVELRPRVSGYIDSIHFEEGQLVQQGDLLFVIDPRPYQAHQRSAEADLKRALNVQQLARSEAERAQRLLKGKAISREEFDQRAANLASAEANVASAQASLDNAQLELAYTQVKSPINGRVGRAYVTRGNLANADQTLLTSLVSVDPVYVYFETDQATYSRNQNKAGFGTGSMVKVGISGDTEYPYRAQLDFVDNQLNRNTGTLQYRAVLANPDGFFKPGQFARVEVPVSHLQHAVLVDQKAVMTDQDRRFVYVVDDANLTARREVNPGRKVDGKLVIHEGLTPGERIIVNGLQKVQASGTQVQPQLVNLASPRDQIAAAPMPDSPAL
ncbi:efflux RND transporter periplasmic adaptor subunit [Ketobacter nezhaii]|uniref:efflux RND transporter periplasmic adaptor subunit n=1 Tax=Ketobacter sp. MCCC 1A13808 TaxID=2602738 RepID=UPI001E374388|nr:efflux RND transporter periplasmic adaptor subunit [Ketobacter sp. MCCC 1A13808]